MIDEVNSAIKYLGYVVRHKYYVLIECAKRGDLIRGIFHDWSKFLPDEFVPYYRHFHGNINRGRDGTGYYKPLDTGDSAFDTAWLLHISRNKHHWEFWIIPYDSDSTRVSAEMKVYEMPLKYRKEMLADWIGAGRAQGTPGVQFWWAKNKDKIILGEETRAWFEEQIARISETAKEPQNVHVQSPLER